MHFSISPFNPCQLTPRSNMTAGHQQDLSAQARASVFTATFLFLQLPAGRNVIIHVSSSTDISIIKSKGPSACHSYFRYPSTKPDYITKLVVYQWYLQSQEVDQNTIRLETRTSDPCQFAPAGLANHQLLSSAACLLKLLGFFSSWYPFPRNFSTPAGAGTAHYRSCVAYFFPNLETLAFSQLTPFLSHLGLAQHDTGLSLSSVAMRGQPSHMANSPTTDTTSGAKGTEVHLYYAQLPKETQALVFFLIPIYFLATGRTSSRGAITLLQSIFLPVTHLFLLTATDLRATLY